MNQTKEQSQQSELQKQEKGALQQRCREEAREMHLQHKQDAQAMKQAHKAQRHQLNHEVREQWELHRLQKKGEAPPGPSSSANGRGVKRQAEDALSDSDDEGSGAQDGDLHVVGVSPTFELSQQEKTVRHTKVAKEAEKKS